MQYETIFDIHNAIPLRWSGMVFGVGVVVLFLMARFRQQALEALDLQQRLASWVPRPVWPASLVPYFAFLALTLVMAIIQLAIMAAPRWGWGVVAGLVVFSLGFWEFQADRALIQSLQNPGTAQMVEGPVARIGQYVGNHNIQHGYIVVGAQDFNYTDDEAGSPFHPVNQIISKGQNVRITYVDNKIIRVERPLCQHYAHCKVSYFLGIRYEQNLD